MKTTIATGLTAGLVLLAGSPLPALAQGAPRIQVPVACIIDYADIGLSGPGIPDQELVLDGPGQSATVSLVGTPPSEKIQLVCNDVVGAQASPVRRTGFPCDVFRGRRGGQNVFERTTDTSISIDRQGRVTLRCTAG